MAISANPVRDTQNEGVSQYIGYHPNEVSSPLPLVCRGSEQQHDAKGSAECEVPVHCNPNHHSFGFIALPRRGLQYAAFDFHSNAELSELMVYRGDSGVKRVDGPGRHGPGNMLFTYFQDPETNLLEWITEIEQIDEATHQPRAWDNSLFAWDQKVL